MVAGYKSPIPLTISLTKGVHGPNFANSIIITHLLDGMKSPFTFQRRTFPSWDITVVLSFLRDKCEPLDKISLRLLTFKTVFLIAMATARRISGIHAISGLDKDIAFDDNYSVDLNFLPEFRAKNQKSMVLSKPFSITSISNILNDDDADNLLCPVRALRQYLRSTSSFRQGKRRLFVSIRPQYKKDISKSTISRWIKTIIILAYDHHSSHLGNLNVKAHELRAISSSLSAMLGTPVEAIMRSAYWSAQTTFLNYYIWDIQHLCRDGHLSFAPAVFAGQSEK